MLEDQNFSHLSNPDTTSLVGNDDGQSSLAGAIAPTLLYQMGTSLEHSKSQRKGVLQDKSAEESEKRGHYLFKPSFSNLALYLN